VPHPQQPDYAEQGWHEPESRLVNLIQGYQVHCLIPLKFRV
jgi:hypothetical protein